jgi:DNA-binding LacI/PurR family transcriptional regulator
MTTTIHDIARACGLNASTVSRALNSDPRIREKTRERILQCARDMNYRPNLAARNLASGRTNSVWLILPHVFSPLEQAQSTHLSRFVREKGLNLLIAIYDGEPDIYERLLRQLEMKLADGAFILPPYQRTGRGAPVIKRLYSNRFPLIFLDRTPELPGVPSVTMVTDNATAVKRLADACLAKGAEALLPCFPVSNSASRERRNGLKGYPRIQKITTEKRVAILASSSEEVLNRLPELRRKHPGTIFSAGVFDYWREDRNELESIAVISQNFENMAANGVETLMKMLNEPEAPLPREIRSPAMTPEFLA